jgi:hypothetical protein
MKKIIILATLSLILLVLPVVHATKSIQLTGTSCPNGDMTFSIRNNGDERIYKENLEIKVNNIDRTSRFLGSLPSFFYFDPTEIITLHDWVYTGSTGMHVEVSGGNAIGWGIGCSPNVTTISGCVELNSSDVYYLTTNIVSGAVAECIKITTADNIVLDCQGYIVNDGSPSRIDVEVNNATIKDCNIQGGFYGVEVHANYLTAYNNTVTLTSGKGISEFTGSNTYFNNILSGGANACLEVQSNSNVYDNIISCWFAEYGNSNNIYNNKFSGTMQVSGGSNFWNTTRQNGTRIYSEGIEIGGNFWNDYSITCTDVDKDGFCDDAYNVSTDSSCIVGIDCGNEVDYLALSDEYASPYDITDCKNIDSAGEYVLQNDLFVYCEESDCYCLGINSDNITVDFNGYKIYSNTTGNETTTLKGIQLFGYDNTTIKNGEFNTLTWGVIHAGDADNITIQNMTFDNINSGLGQSPDSDLDYLIIQNNSFYNSGRVVEIWNEAGVGESYNFNHNNINGIIYAIDIRNSNNVNISDSDIYNISQRGMFLEVTNLIIDNVTIHDTGEEGIKFGWGGSNNVTLSNIEAYNCGANSEACIEITNANNTYLDNVLVYDSPNAVGIEEIASVNVVVNNSEVYNTNWGFGWNDAGGTGGNSFYNTISHDNTQNGFGIQGGSNFILINVSAYNNENNGIQIWNNVNNVSISDGEIFNAGWVGLVIEDSQGIMLENMLIHDCSFRGIWGRVVNNMFINNNTVYNTDDQAIDFDDSGSNITLINSELYNGNGFRLSGDFSNVTVIDNYIHDSQTSINFDDKLSDSLIENNNITGGRYGIYYVGNRGVNNSFINNNVSVERYAMILVSEGHNYLRNNTFVSYLRPTFYVTPEIIEGWDNDIDESNTANGLPIKYLKGINNSVVESVSTNILYIVLSDNVTLKNQNMNGLNQHLAIGGCSNVNIDDVNINGTVYGLYLSHSNTSGSVNRLKASNNFYGALIQYDSNADVFDSTFSDNLYYDLYLWDANVNATNITLDDGKILLDNNSTLFKKWWIKSNILFNSLPIQANVSIKDIFNNTPFENYTNFINYDLIQYKVWDDGLGNTSQESYSSYNITVSKPSYGLITLSLDLTDNYLNNFILSFIRRGTFSETGQDIGEGVGNLLLNMSSPMAIFIILLAITSMVGFVIASFGKGIGGKI